MSPKATLKVLVDLAGLRQPNSGLGRFCHSLARHLADQRDPSIALTLAVPKSHLGAFGREVDYVTRGRLTMLRFASSFDCWHATDQRCRPPRPGITTVRTIHDLIREQAVPSALARLQSELEQLRYLTFVSETTRDVCLESLVLPGELPTRVIRNGVELPELGQPRRPPFLPEGEFFFSLGEFRPRKYFEPQIELMPLFPDVRLVLAGNLSPYPDYVERLKNRVKDLKLEERVLFPGVISDSDRAYLYQNCRAFFMTSKKEGFGLPAVEALRSAKPVFLSTRSSLPEVGGPHAFYWPELNPEPMEQVLREGLAQWCSERSQAAREYSLQFDWAEAARRYLEVYREAAQA